MKKVIMMNWSKKSMSICTATTAFTTRLNRYMAILFVPIATCLQNVAKGLQPNNLLSIEARNGFGDSLNVLIYIY